jgi:hypothetical protein
MDCLTQRPPRNAVWRQKGSVLPTQIHGAKGGAGSNKFSFGNRSLLYSIIVLELELDLVLECRGFSSGRSEADL